MLQIVWAVLAIGIGVIVLKKTTGSATATAIGLAGIHALVADEEGLRLYAYQDQVGIWTIGYGHKIVNGDPYFHPSFQPNAPRTITQETADIQLIKDMQFAINCVNNNVTVPLTQNQRYALISLVYNIGCGHFVTSTLLRELNQANYTAAADQFAAWNKGTINGVKVVLPVLKARREREAELFLA